MDTQKNERMKQEMKKEMQEMIFGIKLGKLAIENESPEMAKLYLEILDEEIQQMRHPALAAVATRKAMLSQPMAGKSDEEIAATREKAIAALESEGYTVINTLFTDEWYSKESMEKRGVVQIPLCFLAKSLENMSLCHAAYFCKGWESARGCRIEHAAAEAYGLKILYENDSHDERAML